MLGRIADDGQDDEADESFADGAVIDEVVDAADEELGADGDEAGGDEEQDDGRGTGDVFLLRGGAVGVDQKRRGVRWCQVGRRLRRRRTWRSVETVG